ncbi:hypothetical protein [Mesorhizobium sp. B1-1-8]|uniref:hypothetical protein n=1 Tax=Mesorhizobium sp. B1-1-8 TaxID=2589976 RepID=UPI001129A1E7|nr:hypothetical protein [Mesorhizobium sp. B1-1-8]UCI07893.1 hypothetical protein FJ974_02085 [Mesorhizobium sp. B1-1-8]
MATVQEKLSSIPARGLFSLLAREFSWFAGRRRRYVDLRDLSPHLLRDMGFLDGKDPHGRHD